MSLRGKASWLAAACGLILTVVLIFAAEPAEIIQLVLSARWPWLGVAFGFAALVVLLRGLRLRVVAGPALPAQPATAVVAVAQFAVQTLPLRLGELALVPLLRASGVSGTLRGLSFLVLLRALDFASLLAWGVVAAILAGTDAWWAAAVLVGFGPLAFLAYLGTVRLLRAFSRQWRRAGGFRRRVLGQLLAVHREFRVVARSPLRAAAVVTLSIAPWAAVWWLTVAELRAMGMDWPATRILLGVVGGSLGASIPISSVGNFGTLEAGWTAALSSVGVPARQALAVGFASHVWGLVFTALFALAGVLYLATRPSHSAVSWRASLSEALSSWKGARTRS